MIIFCSFAVIVWEMVTRQEPIQTLFNCVQQKYAESQSVFMVLKYIVDGKCLLATCTYVILAPYFTVGGRLPIIVNMPEVINELINRYK